MEYSDRKAWRIAGLHPVEALSMLKKPIGLEIGVLMKATVDDVLCSKSAPLSCDEAFPHVF